MTRVNIAWSMSWYCKWLLIFQHFDYNIACPSVTSTFTSIQWTLRLWLRRTSSCNYFFFILLLLSLSVFLSLSVSLSLFLSLSHLGSHAVLTPLLKWNRNSSVSIVTMLLDGWPESHCSITGRDQRLVLFSKIPRLALGPSLSIRWGKGALSLKLKRPGRRWRLIFM